MKCPEAVEWMHRYIDHDLNEEESSVLFEHMQNCPECSEKFAMLNELSAKLEDLPKVTPRFSLVDSILPQLDEIDRARQEGSAAEDIPGMMVAAKSTADINRSTRPARSPRRSRAYLSGALGLAAAMILGVFIYQYEPHTIPDAEIAPQVAYDTNSSAADMSSSSNSAPTEMEENSAILSDQADNGVDGSNPQDDPDGPAAHDSKTSSGNAGNSDGEKAGSSNEGTLNTSVPTEDAGTNAGSKRSDSPANGGQDKAPASAQTDRGGNAAKIQNSVPETPDGTAETGDEKSSYKVIPEKTPVEDFSEASMMGIARFMADNEWSSPDGKYTAELSDQHLYVYRNDSEDRTLLVDRVLEGNWVKGEWSEDGTTFTYETEKDGISAAHVVHPVQSESNAGTGTGSNSGTGTEKNSSANQP